MGCTGCKTGGCSRLAITHDWLQGMLPPDHNERNNIYEVRFKSTRKGFFRNAHGLPVVAGDLVAVDSERGFDLGTISIGGEMARLQMKKKRVQERHVRNIQRVATEEDQKKLAELREKEKEIIVRTRAIIYTLKLKMKLSDVEFQGDGAKAIFYYTADTRVDFRELIKVLASEFRVRIEMRQIGLRQESGLVGGVGSCGRELCCSTWLTDFKSVTTNAARYQNISLNPNKITGMCGRLKCCLNYELETYLDALKDIPDVKQLETELGVAYLQKTDIFKRKMWFSYGGESSWTTLDCDRVLEIKKMNKKGEKPPSLAPAEEAAAATSRSGRPRSGESGSADLPDFVDVVGQSDLHERMDRSKRRRGGKSARKPKGRGRGAPGGRGEKTGEAPKGRGPAKGQEQSRGGEKSGQSKSGNKRRKPAENKNASKPNAGQQTGQNPGGPGAGGEKKRPPRGKKKPNRGPRNQQKRKGGDAKNSGDAKGGAKPAE